MLFRSAFLPRKRGGCHEASYSWAAGNRRTALLTLAASESAAQAAPFDFTYTGSSIIWTVPVTGTYQIVAFGAQGASIVFNSITSPGGLGAEIGGDLGLTAGEVLQIAVGGAGSGGGGSFVVAPSNMPLVIAGGGGGSGDVVFSGEVHQSSGMAGPNGGLGSADLGGLGRSEDVV